MDRLHDVDRRGATAACASCGPTARGGRDVVAAPGHYTEPSFSPDGKTIVFRHAGGDGTRGRLYGDEPGIYVVPADGSATPRLVREGGAEPQFDHTGTRIYRPRLPRSEKFVLVSVGMRRSGLAAVGRATRSCTSSPTTRRRSCRRPTASGSRSRSAGTPSSRRFRTPAVRSTSGPTMQALSRSRASRATPGFYLHWSGDSRRVHWALGPELFTRDLATDVHVPRARASRSRTSRRRRARTSASRRRADAPAGAIALVGARIITARQSGRPIPGRRRRHRERHHRRRRQPHHRRRPVGVRADPGRREARSTSRARRSCPASSTCTRTSAASRDGILAQASWPLHGQPRVRRDDVARSVERHRDRVHERRADPRRARSSGRGCSRPARSSTAPRRRSRPSSRPTTTRCRTCGGRRRSARSRSRATTSSGATRGR